MTRSIIPVNTGEQLKFPLHKPLLLFMNNGKIYCCKIKYAGKDFVTVIDIQERKIIESTKLIYIDLLINNDIVFKRNRIDGYSLLENDEYSKNKNVSAKIVNLTKKR
jgi:hypothetical protein